MQLEATPICVTQRPEKDMNFIEIFSEERIYLKSDCEKFSGSYLLTYFQRGKYEKDFSEVKDAQGDGCQVSDNRATAEGTRKRFERTSCFIRI